MSTLRRVFFYIFVVIYCVSCPLIISYALGYILQPGMEKGIVRTGLISLATKPAGASIYLENKRFTKTTPAILRDLLPGDYTVTVSMKNYQTWTRRVTVTAEKATVLEKIILIPKQWKRRELLTDEFRDLVPGKGAKFIILSKGPEIGDLVVYDRKRKRSFPAAGENYPFKDARVSSSFFSNESDDLLVGAETGVWGQEKFFWINPSGTAAPIRDLSGSFEGKPEALDWDARQPRFLFVYKNAVLGRVDTETGAVTPKLLENIRGYGLSQGRLFVLDRKGLLQKMDIDGKSLDKPSAQNHFLKDAILSARDIFRIKILPDKKMVFLGRNGVLLANRPPYWLVEKGVTGLGQDAGTKKILIWRGGRIGILDFSQEPEAGEDNQETARIDWVYTKGRRIRQAFWVHDGSQVLFLDEDKAFLLETGLYAGASPSQLFEVQRGSPVLYKENTGTVYYLEKTSGRFCEADVIPQKEALLDI